METASDVNAEPQQEEAQQDEIAAEVKFRAFVKENL